MNLRVKHYIVGLVIMALAAPAYARIYKQALVLDKNMTIGSTPLKSGAYEITADDTKKEINILQKGKIIATVQGQWAKLPAKSQYSMFITSDDKITQFEFNGMDQGFQPQ